MSRWVTRPPAAREMSRSPSRTRSNALRPLIGYGPEAMWMAFNPFYPPDLAHYEFAQRVA